MNKHEQYYKDYFNENTMQKEPTIKELLKELGKTRVHTTEFDDMICFSDQDLYLRFKQAIFRFFNKSTYGNNA